MVIIAFVLCVELPPRSQGQSSDDLFDLKQGGQIATSAPTLDQFGPIGIIGGATPGELNAGVTIFRDKGPNYVEIRTPRPVCIDALELFVRSDNYVAGGARSVAEFSLLADKDGDGQFESVLVDHCAPLNDATANRYIIERTTAASFRAEFISGSIVGGNLDGPRIIEIDAFEPSHGGSWPWIAAGAATVTVIACVLLRKRPRIKRPSLAGR